MRKTVNRPLVLLLITTMVMSLCSCGKQAASFSKDDFNTYENTIKRQFSFSETIDSELAQYKEEAMSGFHEYLSVQSIDYGYDELFDYEKAMVGVEADHTVAVHAYSALDNSGVLTKEHLFEIVRKNNAEYLEKSTSIIKDIDDDEFLLRICEIVVDTTKDLLISFPNIDKGRVYCNLGNLKIIEKTSALDFAAVEPGMVLHINRNTAGMTSLFTSSNMYSVLLHETMHILQYGCLCEQIEGCTRRCGLAHAYSEWDQDYADWIWLAEGSAERMACLYSNVEPMTYKNLVNYIRSLDLATVLKENVPANYVETLYFYDDAGELFSLFGADTEEEKREIYQMIYSLEIMQSEPDDVKDAYYRIYGVQWTEDIRDEVNIKIKRPIIQTLTKVFFENLTSAISDHKVSKNDVMFLLNLYESTINEHLRLENEEYDSYNADFNIWYKSIQEGFFSCLENISKEEYMAFEADIGENKINASMIWLDKDKQDFLIEKFESNFCRYKFK